MLYNILYGYCHLQSIIIIIIIIKNINNYVLGKHLNGTIFRNWNLICLDFCMH